MKILIVILILVILWYAFGRKWHFMRNCKKAKEGQTNIPLMDSTDDCESMYNDFASSSNVNFLPIAFY